MLARRRFLLPALLLAGLILVIVVMRAGGPAVREGGPRLPEPPRQAGGESSGTASPVKEPVSPAAVGGTAEERSTLARARETLAKISKAVEGRSVWKEEIKLLMALEDMAFGGPDSLAVKKELLAILHDSSAGKDLAGLVALVLTADPTQQSRKELAGFLGKVKDRDAPLVYAVSIRNPRLHRPPGEREAFWKGSLAFMERESLLTLGFRERVFREEYGKSLDEVKAREIIKPSMADQFESQLIVPFHEMRRTGFDTSIEPGDPVRETLLDYLAKGDSPEAKLHICSMMKSGAGLSAACRAAFMDSMSYPENVRRNLLSRIETTGQGAWETLYDLMPFSGTLKGEMLEKMAPLAGGDPRRQQVTLALFERELNGPSLSRPEANRVLNGLERMRSESSEKYLLELSAYHPNDTIRALAVATLSTDDKEKLTMAQIQARATCAEDVLLKDRAPKVRAAAATALAWLLPSGAKVGKPGEVRQNVQALLSQDLLNRDEAKMVLEHLGESK
jgi:hypothetical protein